MTTKAVVLAAGLGTRMRRTDAAARLSAEQDAAATAGVKALIPIGRPFLDHVLSNVADAGYRQVCLVIGSHHDALRQRYACMSGGRLEFEFAIQPEPLGTANALTAVVEFVGDDPFLLINSDNYYSTGALRSLHEVDGAATIGFDRRGLVAEGHISADRVAQFSVIEQDDEGYLRRIVEKPAPAYVDALPEPVWISMNCWRFGPEIFAACRTIGRSPRGEYEIPDAVMYSMRDLGQRYRVIPCDEPVLDLSSRSDIAAIAERLAGLEVHL